MPFTVHVHGYNTCTSWSHAFDLSILPEAEKTFSKLNFFQNQLEGSRKTRGLLFGSLVPISTSSAGRTAESLLCPTTTYALKVNKHVVFVFAAMIWDILTLAIRVISLAPRALYNSYQRSTSPIFSILQHLDKNSVDSKLKYHDFEDVMAKNDSFSITLCPKGMTIYEQHPSYSEERYYETSIEPDRKFVPNKLETGSKPFLRYNYNLVEIPDHAKPLGENVSTITNLLPRINIEGKWVWINKPSINYIDTGAMYLVQGWDSITRKFVMEKCSGAAISDEISKY